ncbi:catechol 2,3-dioxygenase-like lactoylglutathione lyase family enzyme [Pseudochelatococcus lubricantis]|uniref:Catechol 2,3-dioxygenase-like lactoylglutathione lyase family enzyme n=1 Tax=Pseudochelatococcus lubricantis TaxID=1538102 RepID=A0ABX0V5A7_9HYPH|nr:catechol 2,3-dioxygenase-like lactoylglutathione lyase family enzyme [Pseudochelatococcus lubricantis]
MESPKAILETTIYAGDIDAAEAFYRDVLGLDVVAKLDGKFVFLRCGQQMLLVFNPVESARAGDGNPIPRHGACGSGHVCFRAADVAEVNRWRDRFRSFGIAIEHEHVWEKTGGHSVYIRDPAGNSVEVAEGRIWGFDQAAG